MKKYTYQIVRYFPDRITGEFVNVGLVLYSGEEQYIRARVIAKIGRVKHLFPEVSARTLTKRLKCISDLINNKFNGEDQRSVKKTFSQTLVDDKKTRHFGDIGTLTRAVLPEDDSAIVFSVPFVGIDLLLDNAFDDLYNRLIVRHNIDVKKNLKDKEVWSKYYREFFQKHEYNKSLTSRVVKTIGDELKFDHAIKNGRWNFLEPVAFNLSSPSNVKDKVYKWIGKLNELNSSEEEFNLYLLSVLPENIELQTFIKDRISNIESDNFKVAIIEPSEASSFAKKLGEEIGHSE